MAAEVSEDLPQIVEVVVPSITRNWDPVSLLYDNQWHDSAEVEEEIENIHSSVPELVDVEVIGCSYQGKNISSIRITNEQNTVQKAKTLVVAHHHGREQISIEMSLRFILRLLNGYGEDATLTEYVDTQEIYVILTINPDALDIVVNEGNHWLRKNLRPYDNDGDGYEGEDDAEDVDGDGHISEFYVYTKDYPEHMPNPNYPDYSYYEGIDNDEDGLVNEDEVGLVDLNRNYPNWWEDGEIDVTTQVYRGTAPFSENETRAFRDFALNHRFAMAYSVHSGINATYFTADGSEQWQEPTLYYQIASDFADILPDGYNDISGYPQTGNNRIESALAGGWGEWMYMERGCTVPITFEVYTNASVHEDEATFIIENNSTHVIREWQGIYGYFNPVESAINALWEDLYAAFDYLLEMTPRVDFNILGISGGIEAGEDVDMTMRMASLSPRLGSKDAIYLLDENGEELTHVIAVGGGQTIMTYPAFALPEDLDFEGYVMLVGNDYAGYSKFIISTGGTFPGLNPLLLAAGIGVTVVLVAVVVVVIFWKRQS
ncbi:MAG: M14 family zinc carboxypeptidase [Candidatus Thorarchaeota archaeon]